MSNLTPVYSDVSGVVTKLSKSQLSGNYVGVQSNDVYHHYAHLNSYADSIKEGSKVEVGQLIGYVG